MSSRAGAEAREKARQAEHGAREAAANPALEFAARAGWIVKGLLYGVMGVLALGLAFGRAHATDQKGSLELLTGLAGNVAGEILLIAIGVALAGYALWSYFCALLDPIPESARSRKGIGRRLGFAGSGVAYTALLLFCVQLMLGRGGGTSDSQVPRLVAELLAQPLGPWLAGGAGAAAIGAGVWQVAHAIVSDLAKEIDEEGMDAGERRTAIVLRRVGAAARGAVLVVIGWFVVQAAVQRDPHQAKGMGGALSTLAQQGAGRALLAVLGVGFLAMAAYSIATARWMRMPGAAPTAARRHSRS